MMRGLQEQYGIAMGLTLQFALEFYEGLQEQYGKMKGLQEQ